MGAKYELKYAKESDPWKTLHRNGKAMRCPYSVHERRCGVWCPLFDVSEAMETADETTFEVYDIMCGSQVVTYDSRGD